MGQWHAFWAKVDCGNFRPLLRGVERKHVEVVRSKWKTVEASARPGRGWKGSGRARRGVEVSRRGREGCGRVQKRREGMGCFHVLPMYPLPLDKSLHRRFLSKSVIHLLDSAGTQFPFGSSSGLLLLQWVHQVLPQPVSWHAQQDPFGREHHCKAEKTLEWMDWQCVMRPFPVRFQPFTSSFGLLLCPHLAKLRQPFALPWVDLCHRCRLVWYLHRNGWLLVEWSWPGSVL